MTVSLVNLAILSILLALWTDDVELTFNPFVRPLEFLKILVYSQSVEVIGGIKRATYFEWRQ